MSTRASRAGWRPFQSHSRTPPISLTGAGKFVGAERSSEKTSSRFDFPDPFGPINTLRLFKGRSIPLGPKDRSPETLTLRINMAAPSILAGLFRAAKHRLFCESRENSRLLVILSTL